jgi:hypothetical protein
LGFSGSDCIKLKTCVFDGEYLENSTRRHRAVFQLGVVNSLGLNVVLPNLSMYDINNNTDRPYEGAFMIYDYRLRKFSQITFCKNKQNYSDNDTDFFRPKTFLFCFTGCQVENSHQLLEFMNSKLDLCVFTHLGIYFVFSRYE